VCSNTYPAIATSGIGLDVSVGVVPHYRRPPAAAPPRPGHARPGLVLGCTTDEKRIASKDDVEEDNQKRRVLEAGLGEVVVVVGGVVGEDTEEEPAEAGAVDDDPRRHGRPGGRGGGPRVRVVRGAEAAGPCTHLTPLICGSDTHDN
jgi:hypothetical protein